MMQALHSSGLSSVRLPTPALNSPHSCVCVSAVGHHAGSSNSNNGRGQGQPSCSGRGISSSGNARSKFGTQRRDVRAKATRSLPENFDLSDHVVGSKVNPEKRAMQGFDVPAMIAETSEWQGTVALFKEMEAQMENDRRLVPAFMQRLSELMPYKTLPASDRAAASKTLNRMVFYMLPVVDRYNVQVVTQLLTSMNKLGYSNAKALKALLGFMEARVSKFEVKDLLAATAAAVSLGASPSTDFLAAVLNKSFKAMKFCDAEDVANAAAAFSSVKRLPATFGLPSEDLKAILATAEPYKPKEGEEPRKVRPPKVPEERPLRAWLSRLCSNSLKFMPDLSAATLVNLAHLMAKAGHTPTLNWTDDLYNQLKAKSADLSTPKEYTALFFALTKLSVEVEASALEELVSGMLKDNATVLRALGGSELAVLANCLALYGYTPQAPFPVEFAEALSDKLAKLTAASATSLLIAASELELDLKSDILDEMLAVAEEGLTTLQPRQLAELALALQRLPHAPDRFWTAAFIQAVEAARTAVAADAAAAAAAAEAAAADAEAEEAAAAKAAAKATRSKAGGKGTKAAKAAAAAAAAAAPAATAELADTAAAAPAASAADIKRAAAARAFSAKLATLAGRAVKLLPLGQDAAGGIASKLLLPAPEGWKAGVADNLLAAAQANGGIASADEAAFWNHMLTLGAKLAQLDALLLLPDPPAEVEEPEQGDAQGGGASASRNRGGYGRDAAGRYFVDIVGNYLREGDPDYPENVQLALGPHSDSQSYNDDGSESDMLSNSNPDEGSEDSWRDNRGGHGLDALGVYYSDGNGVRHREGDPGYEPARFAPPEHIQRRLDGEAARAAAVAGGGGEVESSSGRVYDKGANGNHGYDAGGVYYQDLNGIRRRQGDPGFVALVVPEEPPYSSGRWPTESAHSGDVQETISPNGEGMEASDDFDGYAPTGQTPLQKTNRFGFGRDSDGLYFTDEQGVQHRDGEPGFDPEAYALSQARPESWILDREMDVSGAGQAMRLTKNSCYGFGRDAQGVYFSDPGGVVLAREGDPGFDPVTYRRSYSPPEQGEQHFGSPAPFAARFAGVNTNRGGYGRDQQGPYFIGFDGVVVREGEEGWVEEPAPIPFSQRSSNNSWSYSGGNDGFGDMYGGGNSSHNMYGDMLGGLEGEGGFNDGFADDDGFADSAGGFNNGGGYENGGFQPSRSSVARPSGGFGADVGSFNDSGFGSGYQAATARGSRQGGRRDGSGRQRMYDVDEFEPAPIEGAGGGWQDDMNGWGMQPTAAAPGGKRNRGGQGAGTDLDPFDNGFDDPEALDGWGADDSGFAAGQDEWSRGSRRDGGAGGGFGPATNQQRPQQQQLQQRQPWDVPDVWGEEGEGLAEFDSPAGSGSVALGDDSRGQGMGGQYDPQQQQGQGQQQRPVGSRDQRFAEQQASLRAERPSQRLAAAAPAGGQRRFDGPRQRAQREGWQTWGADTSDFSTSSGGYGSPSSGGYDQEMGGYMQGGRGDARSTAVPAAGLQFGDDDWADDGWDDQSGANRGGSPNPDAPRQQQQQRPTQDRPGTPAQSHSPFGEPGSIKVQRYGEEEDLFDKWVDESDDDEDLRVAKPSPVGADSAAAAPRSTASKKADQWGSSSHRGQSNGDGMIGNGSSSSSSSSVDGHGTRSSFGSLLDGPFSSQLKPQSPTLPPLKQSTPAPAAVADDDSTAAGTGPVQAAAELSTALDTRSESAAAATAAALVSTPAAASVSAPVKASRKGRPRSAAKATAAETPVMSSSGFHAADSDPAAPVSDEDEAVTAVKAGARLGRKSRAAAAPAAAAEVSEVSEVEGAADGDAGRLQPRQRADVDAAGEIPAETPQPTPVKRTRRKVAPAAAVEGAAESGADEIPADTSGAALADAGGDSEQIPAKAVAKRTRRKAAPTASAADAAGFENGLNGLGEHEQAVDGTSVAPVEVVAAPVKAARKSRAKAAAV